MLVAAGLAVWLALPAPSLPVLGAVPPFTLVERSGYTARGLENS